MLSYIDQLSTVSDDYCCNWGSVHVFYLTSVWCLSDLVSYLHNYWESMHNFVYMHDGVNCLPLYGIHGPGISMHSWLEPACQYWYPRNMVISTTLTCFLKMYDKAAVNNLYFQSIYVHLNYITPLLTRLRAIYICCNGFIFPQLPREWNSIWPCIFHVCAIQHHRSSTMLCIVWCSR